MRLPCLLIPLLLPLALSGTVRRSTSDDIHEVTPITEEERNRLLLSPIRRNIEVVEVVMPQTFRSMPEKPPARSLSAGAAGQLVLDDTFRGAVDAAPSNLHDLGEAKTDHVTRGLVEGDFSKEESDVASLTEDNVLRTENLASFVEEHGLVSQGPEPAWDALEKIARLHLQDTMTAEPEPIGPGNFRADGTSGLEDVLNEESLLREFLRSGGLLPLIRDPATQQEEGPTAYLHLQRSEMPEGLSGLQNDFDSRIQYFDLYQSQNLPSQQFSLIGSSPNQVGGGSQQPLGSANAAGIPWPIYVPWNFHQNPNPFASLPTAQPTTTKIQCKGGLCFENGHFLTPPPKCFPQYFFYFEGERYFKCKQHDFTGQQSGGSQANGNSQQGQSASKPSSNDVFLSSQDRDVIERELDVKEVVADETVELDEDQQTIGAVEEVPAAKEETIEPALEDELIERTVEVEQVESLADIITEEVDLIERSGEAKKDGKEPTEADPVEDQLVEKRSDESQDQVEEIERAEGKDNEDLLANDKFLDRADDFSLDIIDEASVDESEGDTIFGLGEHITIDEVFLPLAEDRSDNMLDIEGYGDELMIDELYINDEAAEAVQRSRRHMANGLLELKDVMLYPVMTVNPRSLSLPYAGLIDGRSGVGLPELRQITDNRRRPSFGFGGYGPRPTPIYHNIRPIFGSFGHHRPHYRPHRPFFGPYRRPYPFFPYF